MEDNKNSIGQRVRVIVLILGVLFVCWLLLWRVPVYGWHRSIGEGKQVGYVSATETVGIFWKTGTAYIKPTLESTQEDIYCVIDKDLLAKLQEVSVSKERVEVKHFDYLIKGAKMCNGESAVITDFTVLK